MTYVLFHLFTYLLTYLFLGSESFLKNQPFSASKEISRILWNPKFHYRIHTCPPPIPIFSQLDPVHAPTSHFLNIHLNIILPSTPGLSMWCLFLSISQQNSVHPSSPPYVLHDPPYLVLLDLITRTILDEDYRLLSSLLCSFLHSPVTSPLLRPIILLNTLFANSIKHN